MTHRPSSPDKFGMLATCRAEAVTAAEAVLAPEESAMSVDAAAMDTHPPPAAGRWAAW